MINEAFFWQCFCMMLVAHAFKECTCYFTLFIFVIRIIVLICCAVILYKAGLCIILVHQLFCKFKYQTYFYVSVLALFVYMSNRAQNLNTTYIPTTFLFKSKFVPVILVDNKPIKTRAWKQPHSTVVTIMAPNSVFESRS